MTNNTNEFSKFFEEPNVNIVIETQEHTNDISIDDDIVYEIDVYNNFMMSLPLYDQNNKKIQEKYIKLSRHLIHLKNEAKKTDIDDLDDYSDLRKIYDNEFNVSWIFPVVLDKKKIYKKLDIDNSEQDEHVIDEYIQVASDNGIQYEDFLEEINHEIQYITEFNRDKLPFKSYRKLVYDIQNPYIIKKEISKKDVGYQLYLNNYAELLRYFNINNKFWQTYNVDGPEKFTFDQFDEEGKKIGIKTSQILSGSYINIIGFLVLGSEQSTILDALNGNPFIDRIRMIGTATKIKKNVSAIVELKNHGLKNGDKIMIDKSDSEPSINGEYIVKIINENEFIVPVNINDGKEGTRADIYGITNLNMERINIKIDNDYSNKINKNATLYLFPENEINEKDWKEICKKTIPKASTIIESEEQLKNAKTINEMNGILKKYNIEFNKLNYENYFNLTEILDEHYLEAKNKIEDPEKIYKNILEKSSKLLRVNIDDDILFGNKYIFNKDIVKYYGKYSNIYSDNLASRYNWIISSPDNGKLYYLIVELEKIKEYKDTSKDTSKTEIEKRKKELKSLISDTEKELKNISDKLCEKRTVETVKTYSSFHNLYEDNGKITDFKEGDYAIIENNKSHENGMIYIWNGMNWIQDSLIESIDDLCLLGVEKLKEFDIEKLQCLFKSACKSKKKIRLEKRLTKLVDELKFINEFGLDNLEMENKLKKEIIYAELNLQIYMREIIDTSKKEIIELFNEDIDELYSDILKITDMDVRDYYRNLLIKKDGILIDKDIYSIRTKKKICCGHYYYILKMTECTNTNNENKLREKMIGIYGSEDENGMIFCNHDGRPLTIVDYDTTEGLSKTTGEINKQRSEVISNEQKIKDEIIDTISKSNTETDVFDCSGNDLRKELTNMGFKIEDIAKAKDICSKINTLNSKTGIILRKSVFISIIADILQNLQKIPEQTKFKQMKILQMKEQGIDLKQIDTKIISEQYSNLIIIKKTAYIAARLLITYQTLIPQQYPTGKRTGVVFEGFDELHGAEYMALLIEESRIMPIIKTAKNGKQMTIYLPLGKIKDEIIKAAHSMDYMSSIKKLRKDKIDYDKKRVLINEKKNNIIKKIFKPVEKLNDKFMNEVSKAKTYKEFSDFQIQLRGRQAFIAQEIIETINEVIGKSTDRESDNPKTREYCGCTEEVSENTSYYKYIASKTKTNIQELLDESRSNMYYSQLFLNTGTLFKHYLKKNENFEFNTSNIGVNNTKIRTNLFLTYIRSGIFKGQVHEYNEKDICLLTGETKQDILKRKYSDQEEDDLIKHIIKKKMKKYYVGGSEHDLNEIKKKDLELIDNFDIDKLKDETENHLMKDINSFVQKLGKFINKSSDINYMSELKNNIENIGVFKNRNESERIKIENNPNIKPEELVEFENKINRHRISNLKIIINQYFRRYISIIANQHDITDHIKEIPDIDNDISIEIQKYIYDREYIFKKYLIKRNQEIFKGLKIDISSKIISNITAETDIWDKTYSKIENIVKLNLVNLSEALQYILIKNLDRFISTNYEKGNIEINRTISLFIIDIFEKIFEDFKKIDIPDYYKMQPQIEGLEGLEGVSISSVIGIEVPEKETKDKSLIRDKFISEYKKENEKEPTENEIIDYLEVQEKEEEIDKEIEDEEYNLSNDSDIDDVDDVNDEEIE